MCELLAMSSLDAARLTFSLQALASHSVAGATSRDGWGVACYEGRDVALFREPRPADDSPLVRHLETQGPETTLAVSHIRHATQGAICLANTQPFVRELAGSAHVFAHNGNLPGIERLQPRDVADRYRPIGTTDSEHAFCILLQRMHDARRGSPLSIEQRLDVVAAFAAELRAIGPANFLYADGDALFAHGHRRFQRATGRIEPPGLHLLSRRCMRPHATVDMNGVSVTGDFQQVVLVASVPLSNETWRALADGEVIAISGGQVRASRPNPAGG